jgi:large subunit ribosomal protein L7/L12
MTEEKETGVEEPKVEKQTGGETGASDVTAAVKAALKSVYALSAEERRAFIAEYVGKLSVLELSDQVKALEKKFGVSAAPAGMMMPMAAAGGAGEAKPEKTTFNVVLKEVGEKKIQVIKVVRSLTALGLKEAKALVDAAPGAVKEGVSKEEADKMKAELEQAGAVIEVK